jgi:predicted ABC-type ATPase
VFAGPNGAGKTTIVDRHVAGRIPVINPDTIAHMLPGHVGEAARIMRAGRIALHRRRELLASGKSFAIETTLTGRSELDLMRAARGAGFKVSLVYIGLRDVQNSIARVRERVSRGGHDVPYADLIRRFDRSLGHLGEAMAIADRVVLIDNSRSRRQLILSLEGGRIKYTVSAPPAWAILDPGA